jgi:phospholipase C
VWTWLEAREVKRRTPRNGAEPPGPRPRPDLPPGTDLLPQIRHIVVLMMENHSYDNYFGMLTGRGEGFPLGEEGKPAVSNPRADGSAVPANHRTWHTQVPDIPSQSWRACHLQWNGGSNDGFARSVEETSPGADPALAMSYWTERDLPFYYGLARTFPLADHWFSSCLGPTFPNRRFLIAGTANGLIDDLPFDIIDYPPAGTIFDMLGRHGISWANYHHVARYSVMLRRSLGGDALTSLRRLVSLGAWLHPLADAFRGNKTFTADLYPLGFARSMHHLHSYRHFRADAARGTLPAFSIVDPDFRQFSEENPQDLRHGEAFAADVINRVMHGKGWPHTLLIWLYDEHGGYYDHVPPPAAPRPDDTDGRTMRGVPGWLRACLRPVFPGFFARAEARDAGSHRYDRYGFRVPAVIVSPYARPDYVCDEVFDHTSVLKLVEQKWNLPPLTRRDAAASSPLAALDLTAPPAFLTPPELPAPKLHDQPAPTPGKRRRHTSRNRPAHMPRGRGVAARSERVQPRAEHVAEEAAEAVAAGRKEARRADQRPLR